MLYVLVCSVALLASGLTFFTGFGLGTLLLPAFAVFFPVEVAVGLTAVVHLANGLFKLVLVGHRVRWSVVLRFGVPAALAALLGAGVLLWTAELEALASYAVAGRRFDVLPVKLAVAVLMVVFATLELSRRFKELKVPAKYLPLGGVLTGFFGGLSGHQGALRSVFLLRAGLSKEEFIATGVAISAFVDVARLSVYANRLVDADLRRNWTVLAAATASAFIGSFVGSRLLEKITLRSIEVAVAILLVAIAAGLGSGVL